MGELAQLIDAKNWLNGLYMLNGLYISKVGQLHLGSAQKGRQADSFTRARRARDEMNI